MNESVGLTNLKERKAELVEYMIRLSYCWVE